MNKKTELSIFLENVREELKKQGESLKSFNEVEEHIYDLLHAGDLSSELIYKNGDWYVPDESHPDITALNIIDFVGSEKGKMTTTDFAIWFLRG